MNTLERNTNSIAWREIGAGLPRPRAILAISAHWLTAGVAATAMDRPETLHDFAGFPPRLFQFQYPAPGDPELARRVAEVLPPLRSPSTRTGGWTTAPGRCWPTCFPRPTFPWSS